MDPSLGEHTEHGDAADIFSERKRSPDLMRRDAILVSFLLQGSPHSTQEISALL